MDYIPLMTTTTSSSDPYRICCLCNEDVPADRVLHTGVGAICADQFACEVRQGQRLAEKDGLSCVCAICLHEHESTATMVDGYGGELICADEDACEQREEANEKWPQSDHDIDWSDTPEDAAPAHLDGNPDEGHMYPDDGDGYYDTDGWD